MRDETHNSRIAPTQRLMALFIFIWTLTACGGNPATPGVQSLGLREPVTIRFDESMDTASLQLSGTLADESDGGVWSTTYLPNDTLPLSPSSLMPAIS